jgi:aromatic ring-opening dioxygenase catalytic subunit (LigB family)
LPTALKQTRLPDEPVRFWILDFGFWILLAYFQPSYVQIRLQQVAISVYLKQEHRPNQAAQVAVRRIERVLAAKIVKNPGRDACKVKLRIC